MAVIELEDATNQREAVENLFQLYVHDFAEFWAQRQVELGEDGRFPPYPPLAAYWSGEGAAPCLIRVDGRLAGFVLIDAHSHAGLPVDFNMGEFFVARHYRREGIGRQAAIQAIRARPGQWEIAVARRNLPARAFWRGVTSACASGDVEEADQSDERWNGLILRFRVGPA